MKRIVIVATVLVAIVIIGWTVGWFYISGQVRQNVVALASADGQTQPKVTCENLDIGGYPFFMDVTCTNLSAVQGDETATLAELKGSVLLTDPFHALLFATPPLNLSDAFTGSSQRVSWKNLEASARITGSMRIARISVVGDLFELDDTVGSDLLLAKAEHAEVQILDQPADYDATNGLAGLHTYVTVQSLNAPGINIADGKSTLDAEITGLAADVRTYADPALLHRWQAAGGTLKNVAFKGTDGDRSLDVTGNVGLDSAMRPDGQLTVISKGVVEHIDELIPQQFRGLILGKQATDGSYRQTLNLKAGVLFAGLIPITTLPALM